MNNVKITDITIARSAISSEYSLNFREKLEVAKLLDGAKVNTITLAPVINEKTDCLLIKSLSTAVKFSTVAVPVSLNGDNITTIWDALKTARHARLQVVAPVSAVQMEYIAGKKPTTMIECVTKIVKDCVKLSNDVEFVAEDATRADADFLANIVKAVITSGASTVTICDTAGESMPGEFKSIIDTLCEAVPETHNITLGVMCSNTLSMADASSVCAVLSGVREISVTSFGNKYADLKSIVNIFSSKSSFLDAHCSVSSVSINRTCEHIERICTGIKCESTTKCALKFEKSDLTVSDSREVVLRAANYLGYDLSDEDADKVYETFVRISSKKKSISEKELDAIIASVALQVPPTYKLDIYMINTGNTVSATANIRLIKNGELKQGISAGDGPIDAAFLAIEQIVGKHFDLDDFQIQSVTEGREAMGEAIVKLISAGKVYSGRGISTDIVGASINAYINALNKIVYEDF